MARARQPSTIPHPASSILVLKKSSSNGRGKQEEKWEGWSKGGAPFGKRVFGFGFASFSAML